MGPTDPGSASLENNASIPIVTHPTSRPPKSASNTTWMYTRQAPQLIAIATEEEEDAATEQDAAEAEAVDTPEEDSNNPGLKHREQWHQHHPGDATVASAWSPGPTRRTPTTAISTTTTIHPD